MGMRKISSHCSIPDLDDSDILRLLEKPKLNIERRIKYIMGVTAYQSIGLEINEIMKNKYIIFYRETKKGCKGLMEVQK